MHLKSVLTNVTKGTQTITDYMQHVKCVADELAMLDALENPEDLTVKILNGLGNEFKDISSAVRARDTTISFEELHEKLINSEAIMKQEAAKQQKLPIIVNYASSPSTGGHPHNPSWRNQNQSNSQAPNQSDNHSKLVETHGNMYPQNYSNKPCSYCGFCQLCSEQGHTAKQCSMFTLSPVNSRPQTSQSN